MQHQHVEFESLEDAGLFHPPVAPKPDLAKATLSELLLQHPCRPGHPEPGSGTPAPHRARALGARHWQGIRDGADEAIASPGECLDEARVIGGVAQRLAQPPDGGVQIVFDIDEDVVRPEPPLEIVARDHLPGVFDERCQDLEGLLAEPDPHPALEELTGRQIDVEAVEVYVRGHRRVPRTADGDTLRPPAEGINRADAEGPARDQAVPRPPWLGCVVWSSANNSRSSSRRADSTVGDSMPDIS